MTTVFDTMGTVASLDSEASPLDRVRQIFDEFDQLFSLYRPSSQLSLLAQGHLALMDADERVRDTYARSVEWSRRTGGAFSAHRPDGVIDLSGIVKALAMDAVGDALDDSLPWTLGVGGDVLVSSTHASGLRIGISDHADRGRLLTSVALAGSRRAVATSGSAERGDHIWGASRNSFAQVTVIADDIETADVLATAIIAGGQPALDAMTTGFDIDVLAITSGGDLLATPGFTKASRV